MIFFNYSSFVSCVRLACVGVCLSLTAVQACELPVTEIDPAKARRAVQKAKAILQTIQAREKDSGAVFEIFAEKFKNPDTCPKDAFELIAPVWTSLYQKQLSENRSNAQNAQQNVKERLVSNGRGSNQRFVQQRSLQEKRKHLGQDLIAKKSTMEVAYQDFSKEVQRSKNVVAGFGELIKECDIYLATKEGEVDLKQLQRITNSFLGSHLFGVRCLVDRYLVKTQSLDAALSFKRDEINQHYTQDRRIPSLSELHYIEDYLRLIGTMMKIGLAKEDKDWAFAEKVQLYLEKKLTLDDPSAFLQDGYFYHKGRQKSETSDLYAGILGQLIEYTDMSAAVNSIGDAVPLTQKEKKEARAEFAELFQAHQKRVKDHIQALSVQERQNIQKSKVFLYQSLGENTAFAPVSLSIQETKALEKELVTHKPMKKKRGKKKNNHNGKNAAEVPQTDQKPALQAPERDLPKLSDETTTTTTTTTTTMTSPSLSNALPVQKQFVAIPANTQPLPEAEKTLVTAQAEPDLLTAPQKSVKLHQAENATRSKGVAYPPFKEKEEAKTRATMNTASAKVLESLLDPTTSPFTIGYQEALTAMSKLGITELQPKRKGDFRKLVRRDANDVVIGRVFAYCPATSTLGFELMRTYRDFIKDQLTDRPELKALF